MNLYKRTSVSLLLLLLLSFQGVMMAQDTVPVKKSDNKVIIEGTVYYIHIVKPGQTLYSISRAYNVTEKDIALENPGVYSGLQIGQMLKIPQEVPSRPRPAVTEKDTTNYIYHVLRAGENIFVLSRRYNIPASAIKEANPDLDYTDLPIGQVILIPRAKSVYRDEDFILHKVRRRDTFYSLTRRYNVSAEEIRKYNPELQWGGLKTGQIIRIPKPGVTAESLMPADTIKRYDSLRRQETDSSLTLSFGEYGKTLPFYKGKRLKVAFLIPFDYVEQKKDTLQPSDEKTSGDDEAEESLQESLPRAGNFLEFLQGSLMAVDSLKNEGLSLDIHYFDTRKSPSQTRKILTSPFFRNVDLIIGPFYSWNVEIVNEYSLSHHVPIICPFYNDDTLVNTNPYFFQLKPSMQTEFRKASQYLANQFDKNFVFIYNADSLEYDKAEYFRSELIKALQKYTFPENVVIKEIVFDNVAHSNISADLSQALSKDKKNIVIVPVTDEAFVNAVVTQLYFQLRNFDIQVFGMPQWGVFGSNSDYLYYHKLGLTYITPYYYSYQDDRIKDFLGKFRGDFRAEPSFTTREGCPYAFLGHDATYIFLDAIRRYDKDFLEAVLNEHTNQLLPAFHFRRVNDRGGFENESLRIVQFNDDFSIKVTDAPSGEIKPILPPWRMRVRPETDGHDTIPSFRKY